MTDEPLNPPPPSPTGEPAVPPAPALPVAGPDPWAPPLPAQVGAAPADQWAHASAPPTPTSAATPWSAPGSPPPPWMFPQQGPWPGAWRPAPPADSRRTAVLAGLGMLLVGGIIGTTITGLALRSGSNGSSGGTQFVEKTSDTPATAGSAERVAQQLGPAVGTIIARSTGTATQLGSGFVFEKSGSTSYVVTNNHVVAGASNLRLLMPDGRNLAVTVVGTDTIDDLAVVSVSAASLPLATWGHSSSLRVGQAVVAIGSPLGNQGSVTQGVISALHRTIQAGSDVGGQAEQLSDVMQTDASINPGNSGGPLANTDGAVVGVNVAVAGNASNIGYSIPSDLARRVATQLVEHRHVQHPFLGIEYSDAITAVQKDEGFDGPGVRVDRVVPGSPADKAGLRAGDIVQSINGTDIDNGQTLGGLIQVHNVGDDIKMLVHRGSQALTLTATLVERPSQPQ